MQVLGLPLRGAHGAAERVNTVPVQRRAVPSTVLRPRSAALTLGSLCCSVLLPLCAARGVRYDDLGPWLNGLNSEVLMI